MHRSGRRLLHPGAAGIEPDGLSIAKLTEQPIPEDWNEQRRIYGFPER